MTLISTEIYTDSLVIAQTSDTSCLFEDKKNKTKWPYNEIDRPTSDSCLTQLSKVQVPVKMVF